jgi:hypothetical protein
MLVEREADHLELTLWRHVPSSETSFEAASSVVAIGSGRCGGWSFVRSHTTRSWVSAPSGMYARIRKKRCQWSQMYQGAWNVVW